MAAAATVPIAPSRASGESRWAKTKGWHAAIVATKNPLTAALGLSQPNRSCWGCAEAPHDCNQIDQGRNPSPRRSQRWQKRDGCILPTATQDDSHEIGRHESDEGPGGKQEKCIKVPRHDKHDIGERKEAEIRWREQSRDRSNNTHLGTGAAPGECPSVMGGYVAALGIDASDTRA
jgi:hypothetical protein